MKQLLYTSLLLFVIVSACKSKKENPPVQPEQTNANDTATFYDVKGFFESEIKEVNTTPYFIYYKKSKDNKKKDSIAIKNKDFNELASHFLDKDITRKEIKHYYKEDVFRDLSTKSITLSYSTKNKELEIQSIDVLLDEVTNKVKFIFIRTNKNEGDSSIIKQMSWNKGKNFLISTTTIKSDGTKSTSQEYVSWNDD